MQYMCSDPPGEVHDWRPAPTGPLRPPSLWRAAVKQMKHYKPLIVEASREGDASLRRGSLTHYRLRGTDAVNQRALQGDFRWGRQEARVS